MSNLYQTGSCFTDEDTTLPARWLSLHLQAQLEQDLIAKPRFEGETARIVGEIERLLGLLKNVPVAQWLALCHASGMTVFGMIGTAWCRDSTAEHV